MNKRRKNKTASGRKQSLVKLPESIVKVPEYEQLALSQFMQ